MESREGMWGKTRTKETSILLRKVVKRVLSKLVNCKEKERRSSNSEEGGDYIFGGLLVGGNLMLLW